MIGRTHEMEVLGRLYESGKFEFLVMYGRRRVGKTTILSEFGKSHDVIFFPAQEKNDALNLADFSETVQRYFEGDFLAPFQSWEKALAYISGKLTPEKRTVLIIDEFPFLAAQNPAIKSMLQHVIDHDWKGKNLLLILCGSSVSFMVNDIMGYKSPLYGRITSQMEVRPFDYWESAAFFPHYPVEEKLLAYGILGGIPRYLEAFDPEKGIEENVAAHILSENAFLHDEPQMLLRMELREPGVYNSILEAIAGGRNKVSLIADRIHEEPGKCSKYLKVLQDIRLVEKLVPCGEGEGSKRGIYVLTDHFYQFWYHYPFAHKNLYALMGPEKAAHEIMKSIREYMGPLFESICREYLARKAQAGALPFIPAHLGKWWGTNPVIRAQDDVDVLALDTTGTKGLFCECKFRESPMPMEEYDDLVTASMAFPKVKERHYCFFSHGGYTRPVRERAAREGAELLTLKDLFRM